MKGLVSRPAPFASNPGALRIGDAARTLLLVLVFLGASMPPAPIDSVAPPQFRAFVLKTTGGTRWSPRVSVIARPQRGAIIPIQVFFPEGAGHRAFGYVLTFEDAQGIFAQTFRITQAHTWLRYAERDDDGNITGYVRIKHPLDTPRDSAIGRSIVFAGQPVIPPDGLVAELDLETLSPPIRTTELRLHIYVALLSNTRPERLLKYEGLQTIHWQ